jgi:hypothetical protein
VAELIESFDSRQVHQDASGKTMPLKFTVLGLTSEDDVYAALALATPLAIGNMVRGSIDADPLGGGVWKATVGYSSRLDQTQAAGVDPGAIPPPEAPGPSAPLNSEQPGAYNQATFSFSTSGGTSHITQSLATRSSTKRGGGTAPDQKGAIAVAGGTVNGCEKFTPKLEITITCERPTVTMEYVLTLRAMTGRTNVAAFWNFDQDECLYLGAEGQSTSEGKWSVTHRIAVGQTLTSVEVCAGLTIPEIRPWDFTWFAYREGTSENTLIPLPAAAYVEQVYDQGDFAALGIGS